MLIKVIHHTETIFVSCIEIRVDLFVIASCIAISCGSIVFQDLKTLLNYRYEAVFYYTVSISSLLGY